MGQDPDALRPTGAQWQPDRGWPRLKHGVTSTRDARKTPSVPVAAFGKLAEVAGEYLRKGAQARRGQLRTRNWQMMPEPHNASPRVANANGTCRCSAAAVDPG
ncbi:single-stranded DNA-binding protein [Klebsiella pneumoniae]|nr:single-stranded DNA-binding protein [Klebsiella pneumoniae]